MEIAGDRQDLSDFIPLQMPNEVPAKGPLSGRVGALDLLAWANPLSPLQ
jgi:hypothetical protein